MFIVETTEGNGVLHMVWAYGGKRSFYVPQAWLSEQWAEIHGAPIVYVQKMTLTKQSIKTVGRYFALQYLADQRGALVRMSYSWWRSRVALARGWETLKRLGRETCGEWPHVAVHYVRTMAEVVGAWQALLKNGEAMLGETLLEFRGRNVVEVF